MHPCEGEAVIKLTNEKIPMFNAPVYIQNKTQVTLCCFSFESKSAIHFSDTVT